MIRNFVPRDTEALVAIWQQASLLAHPFLDDQFFAQEASNMREIYLPNAATWVATDHDCPIGFIAMIGTEIGGLFLLPAFHGRGIGRAMVDHVARELGKLQVEVFEKNALGRRFYHSYGFTEIDRYLHEGSGETMLRLAQVSS
ncbi:MAG: GNAT family N-acetyltransferase [Novosphingobium sp.]|nr:GNAT family N-acetyltransferase [Novosphingobium sp.]